MVKSEGRQPGLEERRKRRYRPDMVALWEIGEVQKSTSFLIRKLLFVRWVMEITQQIWGDLSSRWWPFSPYRRQQRYMLSIYFMMQICAPSMENAFLWCKRTFNWHEGYGGIWLSISQFKSKKVWNTCQLIIIVINIPFVLISSMNLFSAGKNCILGGSDSGSDTVGWLEILTLTNQPNIECYSCSTSVTEMLYQGYIVIVQNGIVPSSYTLHSSSNLVMLLLIKKSCMFVNTALSTKFNVNWRQVLWMWFVMYAYQEEP